MSCDASLVTWKHERYPSFLTDNSSQNEINMPTHNAYHSLFFNHLAATTVTEFSETLSLAENFSSLARKSLSLVKNSLSLKEKSLSLGKSD